MSESSAAAAAWDSGSGILAGISMVGSGVGIRRGGSRTNPPDEVVRIPELRVGNSEGSGERVGAVRLKAVVEPGVERMECAVELVGGEVVSSPWRDSVEAISSLLVSWKNRG